MTLMNQQIILVTRPEGSPKLSDFSLIESPVPDLKDGEVLLKTKYFSLDPYMRGRMNVSDSYIDPYKLGESLEGYSICTVERSNNPDLSEGDVVLTSTGWQKYAVSKFELLSRGMPGNINSVKKISSSVNPSFYLGALGMPGFTGYYGLNKIGQPKDGETVVVAAATGPVGSMVGQLAKLKGCRVVGIAGGPDKCRFAMQDLGFDACIDHKSKKMAEELKQACPKGIDVYYENVGGPVFSAVLPLLNPFARVPVCGVVYWYNDAATLREPGFGLNQFLPKMSAFSHMLLHIDQTPMILGSIIAKRLKFQGFIISDHYDEYDNFIKEVLPLIEFGKIKVKEDIVKGIEKAPEAFIGLLQGKNLGKLLIEIPYDK